MSQSPDKVAQHLQDARHGSHSALGRALEAARDYLLHVAVQEMDQALKSKAGASDLVQETFLAAQEGFHNFRGTNKEEWLAWLRGILWHRLLTFARAYKDTAKRNTAQEVMPVEFLEKCCNPPAQWTTPSKEAMASEQAQQLDQAIARLPDDYRAVICWRHKDALSFDEIAGRMSRSPEAVRQLWARALNRLRNEMETSRAG
jgi:RNA polymerase sigma-70 factor, ECF subfamily